MHEKLVKLHLANTIQTFALNDFLKKWLHSTKNITKGDFVHYNLWLKAHLTKHLCLYKNNEFEMKI